MSANKMIKKGRIQNSKLRGGEDYNMYDRRPGAALWFPGWSEEGVESMKSSGISIILKTAQFYSCHLFFFMHGCRRGFGRGRGSLIFVECKKLTK
jgi:hypothetical protein